MRFGPLLKVSTMEREDSTIRECPEHELPEEDAKNPWVAMALASFGILIHSVKSGGKPLRVNYRTGKVRVEDGSATD